MQLRSESLAKAVCGICFKVKLASQTGKQSQTAQRYIAGTWHMSLALVQHEHAASFGLMSCRA